MAKSEQATTVVVSPNRKPLHEMQDAPRDMKRARVRVKFREGAGQKVIAGQLVRAVAASDDGWVTLQPVYEDDLPRLQACVLSEDDRALWDRAMAAHKRKLDKYTTKWVDENETSESAAKSREQAIQTYPGSPEAEFYSMTGDQRGLAPFAAVEVLERDLDPPRTEAERQTAALVDRILANGLGGQAGPDPRVDELRAELAKSNQAVTELTKLVADMQAELGIGDTKSKGRK